MKNRLIWEDSVAGKDWKQEEKGTTEGVWLDGLTNFSSVAQSCPTLRTHESQHARSPCQSPTPRVHSDSSPSSQWCHPAISSSVVPFSSCPQPSQNQSFSMSQLFTWGGRITGVSALAPDLPTKRQGWSPSKGMVGSSCSPKERIGIRENTGVSFGQEGRNAEVHSMANNQIWLCD